MKKTILFAVLAVISVPASAGWYTSTMALFDEEVKTVQFRVEAKGTDMRGYEWPCVRNPKWMCGQTASSKGLGGYAYPIDPNYKGEKK